MTLYLLELCGWNFQLNLFRPFVTNEWCMKNGFLSWGVSQGPRDLGHESSALTTIDHVVNQFKSTSGAKVLNNLEKSIQFNFVTERPRTALANMRPPAGSGRQAEPEFEKRSSGQGGEPEVGGQGDRKPLVLSRTIFEKIRLAAKVFTPEERARQKQVGKGSCFYCGTQYMKPVLPPPPPPPTKN